ncbi:hypothetical protein BDW22DRAFT_1429353 [Trametopsis cervina]|nr:hypothetical protein BDW22DRAFT_1429353 [Trametopsis cervina]
MASPTVADLEKSFNALAIIAIIFCALCALFGVYLVLFILAITSTYRRDSGTHKRLRIVTVALFVNLLIHFICRAIEFGRSRIIMPSATEEAHVTIPVLFVSTITSTLAGLLADGLLAWRFYVIFGRRWWALYCPIIAITLNALLGFAANGTLLSFYHDGSDYGSMQAVSFKISVAWGWFIFAVNTVMTLAIMGRIFIVSRHSTGTSSTQHIVQYSVVIEALSESAFVTWFGLLLFEIASLAPTKGHITSAQNFGYVMNCILPIFFGISQCLITVRLGFANDTYSTRTSETSGMTGSKEREGTVGIMVFRSHATESIRSDDDVAIEVKSTNAIV